MAKTFSGIKVTLRQMEADSSDYRPLLKEIKKSEETRIVLDCDFTKIEMILQQANEIELLTDYHNYLITSLDLDKVNIEPYTYMNVNITGFRMVNPDTNIVRSYLKKSPQRFLQGKSNPLYSQNAFMFDAVTVLAKALSNLDSLDDIRIQPLPDRNLISPLFLSVKHLLDPLFHPLLLCKYFRL